VKGDIWFGTNYNCRRSGNPAVWINDALFGIVHWEVLFAKERGGQVCLPWYLASSIRLEVQERENSDQFPESHCGNITWFLSCLTGSCLRLDVFVSRGGWVMSDSSRYILHNFPKLILHFFVQILISPIMIVLISPTHAQFISLLYTLAYMFRPHRAIIRASQITKECRLKCISMNKILEFYKTNG
jgi:hypothetical protein